MKKCKPEKKWIGHKISNSKTGESEWKMKRNQEIKDYRKKPLTGEHLHTPKRKWKKGFKRLAHNLATKNKQIREDQRKEKNKIKRMG
jgi:hypothetical protein